MWLQELPRAEDGLASWEGGPAVDGGLALVMYWWLWERSFQPGLSLG